MTCGDLTPRGDTMINPGVEPNVHPTATVVNCEFGPHAVIGKDCQLNEVTTGRYAFFYGACRGIYTTIGNFVSIALNARLNAEPHPTYQRVAQHHFTYKPQHYGLGDQSDPLIPAWRKSKPVVIGHDVWIGHGAVIMGGVTIGNGAVIGSNAVVTHDVAPYEVVAGVPAKHLKYRFDPDTIAAIEHSQWWDWSDELLKERLEDFKDIALFCKKYG